MKFLATAKSIFGHLQTIVNKMGWHLVSGLLAAIAAAIFFGWLASQVFEGETRGFDDGVRRAVHQTASPLLTATMILFTHLGSVWGIIALLITASAIFTFWQNKRAVVILWVTMAGEVLIGVTLKYSFARLRPASFFDFPLPSSYSFPSGHAFASLCFFGITAWLLNLRTEHYKLKIIVWFIAINLILIIGISRIYLGVHYPSDVIAGYAAGIIWLVTIIFADWWRQNAKPRNPSKQ